jgi:hypothetical protein
MPPSSRLCRARSEQGCNQGPAPTTGLLASAALCGRWRGAWATRGHQNTYKRYHPLLSPVGIILAGRQLQRIQGTHLIGLQQANLLLEVLQQGMPHAPHALGVSKLHGRGQGRHTRECSSGDKKGPLQVGRGAWAQPGKVSESIGFQDYSRIPQAVPEMRLGAGLSHLLAKPPKPLARGRGQPAFTLIPCPSLPRTTASVMPSPTLIPAAP